MQTIGLSLHMRAGKTPHMMHTTCTVAFAVILMTGFSPLPALVIQNETTARHFRFSNDPGFIGIDYDWSGVEISGGDGKATLISPSYVISANHNRPGGASPIGTSVSFRPGFNASTPTVSRTISESHRISGTDIWVGKLDSPILPSENITFYPILKQANLNDYVGMEVFMHGKSNDVGRNVIESVQLSTSGSSTNRTISTWFDSAAQGGFDPDEARVESGDSGAPTFVVWNGQLALIGTHWLSLGGGTGSGDTLLDEYVEDINAVMSGEQVTVIPEPSTLWLAALAGLLLATGKRIPFCRRK